MTSEVERLLAEQGCYYCERAGEYEDWWFRRGRYDHGPEANARWFVEAAEVQAVLDRFKPAGEVLELACGTGLWTRRLVSQAASVTAVDGSPEMLELCRARVDSPAVEYIEADLFTWEPDKTYDICFFGFWLSHVPEERFEAFWEKVNRALGPKGRVLFVDSSRSDLASAVDHKLPDEDDPTMLRRLSDGRKYRIVKRFHEPAPLQRRLASVGWKIEVRSTPTFFIYGQGCPGESDTAAA